MICRKIIQWLGCTCSVVGNGQEGLDYLANPSPACPPPDLILMDVCITVLRPLQQARMIY
jgi:CheY-like chemotaxis protein